ncbi:MAG: hypothetical protein ACI8RZ_001479 [Myxococcota bacterium]|jgi:hypothetical protein
MSRRLQYLGKAKTFRDPDTGALVTDLDSLHRNDALEGDVDDFGYDDFGEFGDDDSSDDDDSDEDFGDEDDDFGDDDDDEFGATRGRQRRQARRGARKSKRKGRRSARQSRRNGGKSKVPPQKTALSGSGTSTDAGAVSMSIIPAHPFKAEDIVCNGSSTGAKVTSIMFGDNLIFNNPAGIDQSVFATSSFIKGLVMGAKATPGVPITINGTIASGGDVLEVTLFGLKPGRPC